MTMTCPRNWVVPVMATTPPAPSRNTAAVWMTMYSDSKPMIDGVRMRLCVTVWKDTVAMACANATTTMTMRLVARCSAMSANPRVPKGIGLP